MELRTSRNTVLALLKIAPFIGLIGTLIGIASIALPWCVDGSVSYTGLDFVLGDSAFNGDFQRYVPAANTALMAALFLMVLISVIDPRKTLLSYLLIAFGFVSLLIVMLFGNWEPVDGLKMILNGGIGLYLAMVGAMLFIVYGIIEYQGRPLLVSTK